MKNGEHVIDVEAMLHGAETPVTDECCIYRVPFHIRKLNEDAYTPDVVSIGPFHHNTLPRLRSMQRHKLSYCKAFLQRTQTTWDTWIRYIQSVEQQIRRCYSDTLPFSEELVKIMFVDSGFILELFCRYYGGSWSSEDVCLSKPCFASSIRQDMLLLENQLPFFVLDHLFNISTSAHARNHNIPSIIQLTFHFFNYYNRSEVSFDDISIRHFTDLLRTFHLQHPPARRPPRIHEFVKHLPSVTELSEVGVRFEVNNESKCLLDFTFSEGVLRIPQLEMYDPTEMLFRNMMALEQCHYPYECYITDYVEMMDFLVNTSRDVDILIQKEVLINSLGDSNSVANLFNGLFKNIFLPNASSSYQLLAEHLKAFHRNRWNNLKSTLKHDYCKTPWQTAATIATVVLLILTLVQTLCSVFQLKQQ